MGTLHFILILAAQYGLFILIRKVDNDYLVAPYVREPVWSYASWGAAVYFEIKPVSFLAWGWVSRFRFDRFLGRRFAANADGSPSLLHRVIRAALGLACGVVLVVLFVLLLTLLELVFTDVLGLPPYLPGAR